MSSWLETVIITIVASITSGLGGWIFARKKNNAEAESVELKNVAQAVAIWREAAENLGNQLKVYNEQLSDKRTENEKLMLRIEELTQEIKLLKQQNQLLTAEIKKLKKNSETQ